MLDIQIVSLGIKGVGSNIMYVGFDGFGYILKRWPEQFKKATRGVNPTYERIGPVTFNVDEERTVELRQFTIIEQDPRLKELAFQIFLRQIGPVKGTNSIPGLVLSAKRLASEFLK